MEKSNCSESNAFYPKKGPGMILKTVHLPLKVIAMLDVLVRTGLYASEGELMRICVEDMLYLKILPFLSKDLKIKIEKKTLELLQENFPPDEIQIPSQNIKFNDGTSIITKEIKMRTIDRVWELFQAKKKIDEIALELNLRVTTVKYYISLKQAGKDYLKPVTDIENLETCNEIF